ncbi:hypothetical protein DFH27DRAFT_547817 [Peziza echinospora]|nr:hypothetical protein DFH27DRAFT_547817 [Peziza echinospora]
MPAMVEDWGGKKFHLFFLERYTQGSGVSIGFLFWMKLGWGLGSCFLVGLSFIPFPASHLGGFLFSRPLPVRFHKVVFLLPGFKGPDHSVLFTFLHFWKPFLRSFVSLSFSSSCSFGFNHWISFIFPIFIGGEAYTSFIYFSIKHFVSLLFFILRYT